MFYYACDNHILASDTPMAFEPLPALPETGDVFWLFQREPLAGRETFAVSDGGLFTALEDVSALSPAFRRNSAPPLRQAGSGR